MHDEIVHINWNHYLNQCFNPWPLKDQEPWNAMLAVSRQLWLLFGRNVFIVHVVNCLKSFKTYIWLWFHDGHTPWCADCRARKVLECSRHVQRHIGHPDNYAVKHFVARRRRRRHEDALSGWSRMRTHICGCLIGAEYFDMWSANTYFGIVCMLFVYALW